MGFSPSNRPRTGPDAPTSEPGIIRTPGNRAFPVPPRSAFPNCRGRGRPIANCWPSGLRASRTGRARSARDFRHEPDRSGRHSRRWPAGGISGPGGSDPVAPAVIGTALRPKPPRYAAPRTLRSDPSPTFGRAGNGRTPAFFSPEPENR